MDLHCHHSRLLTLHLVRGLMVVSHWIRLIICADCAERAVVCFYQPDQCGSPADDIGIKFKVTAAFFLATCNSSGGIWRTQHCTWSIMYIYLRAYAPLSSIFSECSACNQ